MPFEDNPNKRPTIVVGDCLRKISFENFTALLSVANRRVNLDIENVNLLSLEGYQEAINEARTTVKSPNYDPSKSELYKDEDENMGFLRLLSGYSHP